MKVTTFWINLKNAYLKFGLGGLRITGVGEKGGLFYIGFASFKQKTAARRKRDISSS